MLVVYLPVPIEGLRVVTPITFCWLQAFAHVVFGVSKDYCASGFRVGAVWTQNEAYIKCVCRCCEL